MGLGMVIAYTPAVASNGRRDLTMKILCAVVGLVGLLFAGTANAGLLPGNAIYSSFVTNLPDQALNPTYALVTGTSGTAGSPLSQEFHVTGPTQLTSLWLRLSDTTAATDGGSILVYLVPDTISGNLPTNNGSLHLTGASLLTTIADSTLPTPSTLGCGFGGVSAAIGACNTLVSVNASIPAAGDYWIALVNGSDGNNGGTLGSSGARWWRAGDNNGLNAAGLFNSHVNTSATLTSQNASPFELQVNAPEPGSAALLGAGLVGLGLAGRRWNKKSVG
jgi:hypothetical protein